MTDCEVLEDIMDMGNERDDVPTTGFKSEMKLENDDFMVTDDMGMFASGVDPTEKLLARVPCLTVVDAFTVVTVASYIAVDENVCFSIVDDGVAFNTANDSDTPTWVISIDVVTGEVSVGDVTVEASMDDITVEASMDDVTVEVIMDDVTVEASMGDVTVEVSMDDAVTFTKDDIMVEFDMSNVTLEDDIMVEFNMGDVTLKDDMGDIDDFDAFTVDDDITVPFAIEVDANDCVFVTIGINVVDLRTLDIDHTVSLTTATDDVIFTTDDVAVVCILAANVVSTPSTDALVNTDDDIYVPTEDTDITEDEDGIGKIMDVVGNVELDGTMSVVVINGIFFKIDVVDFNEFPVLEFKLVTTETL